MSDSEGQYSRAVAVSLGALLKEALALAGKSPALAAAILKIIHHQKQAGNRRRRLQEREGIHVPPYLIASVTGRCNLKCKGCYARAQERPPAEEMTTEGLESLFEQARELGTSVVVIAGGEPLMRKDLFAVTRRFPEIVFAIFTNGLLIDDEAVRNFREQRHVVPVLSIEGDGRLTDLRRGEGVYERINDIKSRLERAGIFWGISFTLTRTNFDAVLEEDFIRSLRDAGSRIFFFVEYVPVSGGTEELTLTAEQNKTLSRTMEAYRARLPGIFVAFPGDEEAFGGCMAAGRGFIHVSSSGDVEPCPFAPYSDANLARVQLKEALRSSFLRAIRTDRGKLKETSGGCALWTHREWVRSLLSGDGR